MKFRILTVALILPALWFTLRIWAQPASPPPRDESATREQILKSQFVVFRNQVLTLMHMLEKSDRLEDQEQAKILKLVLDEARDSGIETKLDQTIEFIRKADFKKLPDCQRVAEDTEQLAQSMKKIVDLLRTDNRTAQSKQEKDRLTKLLKDIEDLIRRQKQLEAENRLEKTDSKDIADRQGKAAEETDKLARSMGNKDQKGQKSDPGGEAKNEKSQPKDGGKSEGKMGGKSKGEEKPGETKKSEPKEGKDQDGKDAKPGEAKAGKPGDKGPETKPGEAKPGDKGGENKPQAKESPKGAENKPSEPKAGGSETKKGEAKPGDKSQGKSSAKPGQGPDQPPQDPQAKKDNQNTPPSPKGDDSQDDLANSKKRMREAYDAMKQAQKDLEEKKTKPAGDKQVEAIKDLEQVKKDLEDLLRIKREEEMEKLLVQLIDRCQRMLALQKIVLEGTEQVFNSIQANSIKKANDANRQESAKLSEKERDIIGEADRAIELLQGEGSGVAVPEAFHQVREDMKHVWKRLDVTDPGLVTQAIENDIIASLEDMIKALKQAEKKLKDKKDQPPMPPSPPKPPPDQKLLDQIAELKMIRALQVRVNNRTETYGRMYQGEQAGEPNIQGELRGLSERQNRIFEITRSIAKGDNK